MCGKPFESQLSADGFGLLGAFKGAALDHPATIVFLLGGGFRRFFHPSYRRRGWVRGCVVLVCAGVCSRSGTAAGLTRSASAVAAEPASAAERAAAAVGRSAPESAPIVAAAPAAVAALNADAEASAGAAPAFVRSTALRSAGSAAGAYRLHLGEQLALLVGQLFRFHDFATGGRFGRRADAAGGFPAL